jgi:F420-dependent oxidoreductase-like protein
VTRFGAFVPQGWKLEYTGVPAADAWARSMELARRAESVGYDHLWVYDHMETIPRREATHVFEAWTTMAALAHVTTRVELGQLVTCATYRNPGLLAKQAACIDVMSNGRLIFGLGAGWYEAEYESYGWGFPPAPDRLQILDETLAAVRMLWTQETTRFYGEFVELHDAYCDPKPLRSLPPIWVGGGGEKVTLRIAARHADATNWQVGLDDWNRKSRIVDEHCERLGRDPATLTRTLGPDCILFDSDADLRRWLASPGGGHLWGRVPDDAYVADNLIGTPAQVAEKAQAFVDAGCAEFVLWFRDVPSDESMTRFQAEVAPQLT